MPLLSVRKRNRLFIDQLFFMLGKNRVIHKKNKILHNNTVKIVKFDKI